MKRKEAKLLKRNAEIENKGNVKAIEGDESTPSLSKNGSTISKDQKTKASEGNQTRDIRSFAPMTKGIVLYYKNLFQYPDISF